MHLATRTQWYIFKAGVPPNVIHHLTIRLQNTPKITSNKMRS